MNLLEITLQEEEKLKMSQSKRIYGLVGYRVKKKKQQLLLSLGEIQPLHWNPHSSRTHGEDEMSTPRSSGVYPSYGQHLDTWSTFMCTVSCGSRLGLPHADSQLPGSIYQAAPLPCGELLVPVLKARRPNVPGLLCTLSSVPLTPSSVSVPLPAPWATPHGC